MDRSRPDYEDSHVVLRQALRDVGRALGGTATLFHPMGLLAGAAWVSATAAPELDPFDGARLELAGTPGVRVAVGEAEPGIAGFRATYLEALAARRIATLCRRPEGSVTRYGPVALQALATVDLDQAEAFYRRELGPLAEPTEHVQVALELGVVVGRANFSS